MSTIYVLRHAQSVGNADPTLYGTMFNPDMALIPQGEKEANAAGALIQEDIGDPTAMAVFSSHYLRAVQTAEIIGKHVGHRKVKQSVFLAERHYGEADGGTDVDNFADRPMERHAYNTAGHLAYSPVRGESLFDVHMRVALFCLQHDSFRFIPLTIIVSHASTCLMLHAYFTGEMPKREDKWKNCEIRKYTALSSSSEFAYEGKLE